MNLYCKISFITFFVVCFMISMTVVGQTPELLTVCQDTQNQCYTIKVKVISDSPYGVDIIIDKSAVLDAISDSSFSEQLASSGPDEFFEGLIIEATAYYVDILEKTGGGARVFSNFPPYQVCQQQTCIQITHH